jgi:hypothetical protein
MSKSTRPGKPASTSLIVAIQPKSPQYQAEIGALKRDLALIARKTTSGGITQLTLVMWNMARAKCAGRLNKFIGLEEATDHIADEFERAIAHSLPRE